MGQLFTIHSYELKKSHTGHYVPVINDIHLHSLYDPIKEAKKLIQAHQDLVESKRNFLILGLGLGHHVQELIKKVNELGKSPAHIVIIEPCTQLIEDYKNLNTFSSFPVYQEGPHRIEIIQNENVEDLLGQKSFIDFLATKPGVLTHPPSLNVFTDYFKTFLNYSSPQNIQAVSEYINNSDLKNYLLNFGPEREISDLTKELRKKNKVLSQQDFLLLAFEQLN